MSNTSDNSKYKMSQEHLDALKDELRDLLENKDKEISEKIKEARSFGDLTENSEYDEAKNEQGKLHLKIAELKDYIENAIVISYDPDDNLKKITMGSIVTILEDGETETEWFQIVASQEADPRKHRISDESPIGSKIIGHEAGQTVLVELASGPRQFTIIDIKN